MRLLKHSPKPRRPTADELAGPTLMLLMFVFAVLLSFALLDDLIPWWSKLAKTQPNAASGFIVTQVFTFVPLLALAHTRILLLRGRRSAHSRVHTRQGPETSRSHTP